MTFTESTQRGEYEAIVVGGSFAGLSAAMQLALARRQILVVDAGRPRNRFARSAHGFLGQDGRTPREILDTARQQVGAYPTVHFSTDAALRAREGNGSFYIGFADGREAEGRRIVLATGVTDHLPDIPGVRELW